MIIIQFVNRLWAYCQHCMDRQDFIFQNGEWVCEQCGHSLSSRSV